MTALEGEIVGVAVAPAATSSSLAQVDERGTIFYVVHSVDLPNGGGIEGMGREDALRIARQLGTRAYQAQAALVTRGPQAGLVIIRELERIS